MCGRFSLFAPRTDVAERFGATFVDGYLPRYNAAPGQHLPILPDVTTDEFHEAAWGLVPTWADDEDDGRHINARAETAAETASFEASVRGGGADGNVDGRDDEAGSPWEQASAGRCLVPADGFYEWGDRGDGRRPYRLEVRGGDLFAMAGLWTRWKPEQRQSGLGEFAGQPRNADWRHTFAILTTAATGPVSRIHDRMPVILEPDEEGVWLDATPSRAVELLDPYEGTMGMFAVSDEVNDPANDRPTVVEPIEV